MRSLLVLVLLTSPALADTPKTKTAETMHADDCAVARKANKTCELTFTTADTIDGNSPTASGTTVATIPTGKEPSLIRVRHDFVVEIIKSAEDL